MKEFIPPDENWNNAKSCIQIVVVAILFIGFVIWLTSCASSEKIVDKGCFYYSRKHSLQLDSLMQELVVGSCKMTVNGVEYTFWTNDSIKLKNYKLTYPDAIFIDCYDYTKSIQQKHFKVY